MESHVTESVSLYKLWAWFEANKKQAAWGAAIFVALGVIVWFIIWQQGEKEVAAGEALSNAFVSQMIAVGSGGPRPDLAASLLRVAADYPKSSAGAQALLIGAGDLFEAGKFAEAQAQFEKFAREYRESRLEGQAQLGIAACLDAQGKTEAAVAAYKNVIERRSSESLIPQAKFALACLYEAQNKPEQALTLFEDAARAAGSSSSIGSEAGMRWEELRIKHPELVQSPPSATALTPTTPASKTPPSTNAPPTSATPRAPASTPPAQSNAVTLPKKQ